MEVEALLPEHGRLAVERLRIEPTEILLELRCTDTAAQCPDCQGYSRRVHSRYARTIRDLPWRGTPVILRWQVRRFFCDNPDCRRRIFAEQLAGLVSRRGRDTIQREQALLAIGLECGGEPGRRLGAELGITTSGDTLLRRVRRVNTSRGLHPAAIGIDDFAFRKGQRYGTVIVDHESGRVLDLLPERSSESTAEWLRSQPQVEVVTRDRSALYANGITSASPQAVQVADRFHLHVNLREAVIRMLDHHHRDVTAAAKAASDAPRAADALPAPAPQQITPATAAEEHVEVEPDVMTEVASPPVSKQARCSIDRRAKRLARYERVVGMHASGVGVRAIARELKIGRETVKRFLRAGSFPERAKARRFRGVDPYVEELRRLWDTGMHNARALYRHIRGHGFEGSSYSVCRCVAAWRDPADRPHVSGPKPRAGHAHLSKPVRVSSNRLAWLLIKDDIERDEAERRLIRQLLADCAEVRAGVELAQAFKPALAEHRPDDLWAWTQRASQAGVPAEIRAFAEGLVRDAASVGPAVLMKWNNGRAEGHVNRIKLIKRKMYGRANFDLLRARVLAGR